MRPSSAATPVTMLKADAAPAPAMADRWTVSSRVTGTAETMNAPAYEVAIEPISRRNGVAGLSASPTGGRPSASRGLSPGALMVMTLLRVVGPVQGDRSTTDDGERKGS